MQLLFVLLHLFKLENFVFKIAFFGTMCDELVTNVLLAFDCQLAPWLHHKYIFLRKTYALVNSCHLINGEVMLLSNQ